MVPESDPFPCRTISFTCFFVFCELRPEVMLASLEDDSDLFGRPGPSGIGSAWTGFGDLVLSPVAGRRETALVGPGGRGLGPPAPVVDSISGDIRADDEAGERGGSNSCLSLAVVGAIRLGVVEPGHSNLDPGSPWNPAPPARVD